MTNLRTKARLAVSEFQSASRAKFEADRDFTRAHDQLGKFIDDLIMENEELRKLATLDVTNPVDASLAAEMSKLRRKLGLVTP